MVENYQLNDPNGQAVSKSMMSDEELDFLQRVACYVGKGCVVEIGSWRGRSAIALAKGLSESGLPESTLVYCVEPHEAFVGFYGYRFGPADRKAFFEAVLNAQCSERIALVNLKSLDVVKAWTKPIGLLLVDGDHTYENVEKEVAAWLPLICEGGHLIFNDALDANAGPYHVIKSLVAAGKFREAGQVGKVVWLQKLVPSDALRADEMKRSSEEVVWQRARDEGCDGAYALARLEYGSFASTNHRYVYIETPKVACTSFKKLVSNLEQSTLISEGLPYHRLTSLEMAIHQRRRLGIPTLVELPAELLSSVLNGNSNWFVFALVRNPFSRLVATFENKIRLGEPGYGNLEPRFRNFEDYGSLQLCFQAFVEQIVADDESRNNDVHLRPQSELLLLSIVKYSRIFKYENISDAVEALNSHLKRHGTESRAHLPELNRSRSRDWRLYFNNSSATLVGKIYSNDFKNFGYDRNDWFTEHRENLAESASELSLRKEIVTRNRMLDYIYDRLGLE